MQICWFSSQNKVLDGISEFFHLKAHRKGKKMKRRHFGAILLMLSIVKNCSEQTKLLRRSKEAAEKSLEHTILTALFGPSMNSMNYYYTLVCAEKLKCGFRVAHVAIPST